MTGMVRFWLTELIGKGTKLGEGEGSKLGEPCPKVRLSQDRLPIEPFALKGLLRANVVHAIIVRANVASRKCCFAQMSLNQTGCCIP
jgi:hypothetical protein